MIFEALASSRADVSSRTGFEDEHFEETETDAWAVISDGRLCEENIDVEVFLLSAHMCHLFLFLRDF